jgi:hypothetical protein
MPYAQTIDHICMTPSGRVQMNNATSRLTKEEKRARQRIATSSFVATTQYRAALDKVRVCEHDSSWCHMRGGEVLARFDTMSDAVVALTSPQAAAGTENQGVGRLRP